jgi:hypothetical protein
MSFNKKNPFANVMALVLTPVYIFIASFHIFFLPSFLETSAAIKIADYKTNTQSIYYLVRNDRSTFSQNKNTNIIQKKKALSSAAVFIDTRPSSTVVRYSSFVSKFRPDHHHSWLSNRIMRI